MKHNGHPGTKRILPFVLASVLCLIVLFTACSGSSGDTAETGSVTDPVPAETGIYVNELFYDLTRDEGIMELVMFRVGKADAMLITTENCNILLDTGEKDDFDADKIIEYCKTQNISHLDAVIVSNVLTDNIGGYEKICQALTVDEVIEPSYNATGHRYTKFLRTVIGSGASLTSLSEVTERTFDDVTFTFYPAENPIVYDTEQDMSLVVSMTHGKNTFLFCGNIREERIAEITETVTEPHTVVKLPDHGFLFDGMDAFLSQYAPEYVLISDSALNEVSYELLSMLAEKNITYYRTRDAYVCMKSDGKNLTFSQK